MPRWLSGLNYVLSLLDRWIDSLSRLYFFTFFATQLLMHYDVAAYSAFATQRRLHYDVATYSVYDIGTNLMLEARSTIRTWETNFA